MADQSKDAPACLSGSSPERPNSPSNLLVSQRPARPSLGPLGAGAATPALAGPFSQPKTRDGCPRREGAATVALGGALGPPSAPEPAPALTHLGLSPPSVPFTVAHGQTLFEPALGKRSRLLSGPNLGNSR
jgi:hypothetical protein